MALRTAPSRSEHLAQPLGQQPPSGLLRLTQQSDPVGQTCPHPPQLLSSLNVSTHCPLHAVGAVNGQQRLPASSAQVWSGPQQAAPQVMAPNGQSNRHWPPRQVIP